MWPPQVSRLGQQHRFTSGLPSMQHFQFSAIKCILIHGFIRGYSHNLYINHVPTYINTTKKLLCDHLLLVQNIVMLQASSAGSPSPATATVAKYLLKLWIQQRLEQVSCTWHDVSRVTCHVDRFAATRPLLESPRHPRPRARASTCRTLTTAASSAPCGRSTRLQNINTEHRA